MRRLAITAALLTSAFCASAQRRGVVEISVANMREEPDYTAEMGTQALMGTEVEIVGSESYWLQVITPDGYKAWTNAMSIKEMDENQLSDWKNAGKLICMADHGTVFSQPSLNSQPVSDLVRGDRLVRLGKKRKGFLHVSTPGGKTGWVKSKDLLDEGAWSEKSVCSGDAVVREALRQVGVPYLWGGASPKGFDCSGLTSFSAFMNGRILPRNASQQAKLGAEVKLDELQKGDLLFFGNTETGRVTHVGIYIGDGHIVHASQLVRINSIVAGESDVYENMQKFLFARRIFTLDQ